MPRLMVTVPFCCCVLQGIPELQQLLAYTTADVVHHAAER
jgi:hypothetical protein